MCAQLKQAASKPSLASPYARDISYTPVCASPPPTFPPSSSPPSPPPPPPRVYLAATPLADNVGAPTATAQQRDDSLATFLPDTPGEDEEASGEIPTAIATARCTEDGEARPDVAPVAVAGDSLSKPMDAVCVSSALSSCIPSSATAPSPQTSRRSRRPPSIPAAIAPATAAVPLPAVSSHGSTPEEAAKIAGRKEAATEPAVLLGSQEQAFCSERGKDEGGVEAKAKKKRVKEGEEERGEQLRGQGRTSMEEVGRWLERFDGRFKHSLKTFEQCMG